MRSIGSASRSCLIAAIAPTTGSANLPIQRSCDEADRDGIEEVVLLAADLARVVDQARRLEHVEMAHDAEPGHRRQVRAQLAERLAVALEQPVEEEAPARVAERPEVGAIGSSVMPATLCDYLVTCQDVVPTRSPRERPARSIRLPTLGLGSGARTSPPSRPELSDWGCVNRLVNGAPTALRGGSRRGPARRAIRDDDPARPRHSLSVPASVLVETVNVN